MRTREISVQHVEDISFRVAQKYHWYNEPIPPFSTSDPNKLESCVKVPFQRFSKRALYPTLISKASILFYLLIKNHPFLNGNKRIAITTTQLFLARNKKWLELGDKVLYDFTLWIATSMAGLKDPVVGCIEYFFKKHLITLDPENPRHAILLGQPRLF